MTTSYRAWAAPKAGAPLEPFEYDPGPLGAEEVEITVDHCGLCHSDLSMLDNDWGFTAYPFVPGHEAVGRVTALGANAKGVALGQRVGLGWNARSCLHCEQCLAGEQHLCREVQATLARRHGAFAEKVRAHWGWVVPLPEGLEASESGPLLCGGITVFAPLRELGIAPTARVGVIGIGGLGHMALKFCRAWGCEVTAFTTSASKEEEARAFGAHRVVTTGDAAALKKLAGTFDPDHRHGQRGARLARPDGRAGAEGAAARGGRAAGAGGGAGVLADLRAEVAVGLAHRVARGDRQHARLRRPPRRGAADRALPDEPSERGAGSSARRQGPLPDRAGRRLLRINAPGGGVVPGAATILQARERAVDGSVTLLGGRGARGEPPAGSCFPAAVP